MNFVVNFSVDNSVFEENREAEISIILADVAENLEDHGFQQYSIFDSNGNKIGYAKFES